MSSDDYTPDDAGDAEISEAASQAIEDLTVKLVRTRADRDAARATIAEAWDEGRHSVSMANPYRKAAGE